MTSGDTSTARVALQEGERGPVIRIVGELDAVSSALLADACAGLDGEQLAGSVEVDLEEVTFLDATALGVLAGLAKQCDRAGGTVVLMRPSSLVRRLLHVTAIEEAFVIVAGADPEGPGGQT